MMCLALSTVMAMVEIDISCVSGRTAKYFGVGCA